MGSQNSQQPSLENNSKVILQSCSIDTQDQSYDDYELSEEAPVLLSLQLLSSESQVY